MALSRISGRRHHRVA